MRTPFSMLPFPCMRVKKFCSLMTGAISSPVALGGLLRTPGSVVKINPRLAHEERERSCCRTFHANELHATVTAVVPKVKTMGWMYRSWLFPVGCARWNANRFATHALYPHLASQNNRTSVTAVMVTWEMYVRTFLFILLKNIDCAVKHNTTKTGPTIVTRY
jgi:hypothetical protein